MQRTLRDPIDFCATSHGLTQSFLNVGVTQVKGVRRELQCGRD